MVRETRRLPIRLRSVALGTIRGEAERNVVGVCCLVEIGRMAGSTIRRRTSIARRVAVNAVIRNVRPRQREGRHIMIKNIIRIPCRVAGQASRIFIHIPPYPGV